jgi:hypothetical protein
MKIPESELSRAPWTKSSRSGDATNCVEVVAIDWPTGSDA